MTVATLFTTFNTFSAEKLRLIGDQNFATGEKFKETEIGGLSGLAYDSKKNRILAISDDRSATNDARFYEFEFKLNEKSFSVSPVDVITIKNKEGKAFPKGSIDPEDIAIYNESLLIPSEGWINKEPPINPEIFEFTRDGNFKSNLEIPSKFNPLAGKEGKAGIRDNLGFEAMTVSKDGRSVWVGVEEALFQDDRVSGPRYASVLRLIQFKDLKPSKEVAYQLDKIPGISVAGLTVGETGLSSMIAIDDSIFYSIERSYMPLVRKNVIRLYKFTITDKTTDISKMDSIKDGKNIVTVEKELIANLEDFTSTMGDKFQSVDNIEGMCLGPKLANGHNTLLMVSDNNFKKKQRTQFLAFEIVP
jgi:hypothetical protein